MKKQHVINCSFSAWYEKFKHLTIPSKVIPLPKDFVDYLLADGIHLPSDDSAGLEDEDEDKVAMPSSFGDVKKQVDDVIKDFGGFVFPKLNWSSPKDAVWIAAGHSLSCYNLNDIILLLKTSEFVTHDLAMPYDKCEDIETAAEIPTELVLRKWMDINPSMEFRVFVKDDKIRGISQRDHSNFFTDVSNMAEQLRSEIEEFYEESIEGNFADKDYVFDIYRRGEGDFILLDFNPFGGVTDALLFSWEDLEEEEEEDEDEEEPTGDTVTPHCEFRCVESTNGIQPSPYLSYGYPKDIDDIASGAHPGKLVEFLKMEKLRQTRGSQDWEDEDDDEEDDT